MLLKKIEIGKLHSENNVFSAPLAGYTNAPFRDMCRSFGAGLTFTEMVSAKGLCFGSEKTKELLHISLDYTGVKACQIFGNDPYYMRKACESEELAPFELIDINMGCPVPKIYKNGEGSALMGDFALAEKIIKECKKSGKYISVKFRTGLTEKNIVCAEFAKMCEGAGADMICIHGRTRDKIYSGEVNFVAIAAAKKQVKIPVIANGGVFSAADAERLLNNTGADGVAVARGAMYKPWVFAEIVGGNAGDKKAAVKRQLKDTCALYGERFACVFMRKMIGFYLKGAPSAAALRSKLFACQTLAEVEEILNTLSF